MAELFKGLIGNEVTFAPEGDPIIDWTTLFFKKKIAGDLHKCEEVSDGGRRHFMLGFQNQDAAK